jgi:hypothetical protein
MRQERILRKVIIYVAYAIKSLYWLPFVVLSGWFFGFFVRDMIAKDKSLSRYKDFAEYKKRICILY